jgi:hypothetical protein
MKNYISIISLVFLNLLFSCNSKSDIDYTTRDQLLEKAYIALISNDDSKVVGAIKIIKQHPTYDGLRNLITLWEEDIDIKTEKELLSALVKFEEFRYSDSLISEIFERNYKDNLSMAQNNKLIRLLERSSADICSELIKKLKSS